MIKRIGVIGASQMGSGIAHVCALGSTSACGRRPGASQRASSHQPQHGPADRPGMIRPGQGPRSSASDGADYKPFRDCGLRRSGDREQAVKARSSRSLRRPAVERAARHRLVDFGDAPRAVTDRPGKFMGITSESGDDGSGRADPRHCHRGETFRTVREVVVKLEGRSRSTPRISRPLSSTHPAADDQRGGLRALRRRGQRRGDDTGMKWAPTTRWARSNSPTSSASTPACRSCRSCTRDWPIQHVRVRCS